MPDTRPDDLGWIRHRLDTLAAGRTVRALGPDDAALYRELCALEVQLLRTPRS